MTQALETTQAYTRKDSAVRAAVKKFGMDWKSKFSLQEKGGMWSLVATGENTKESTSTAEDVAIVAPVAPVAPVVETPVVVAEDQKAPETTPAAPVAAPAKTGKGVFNAPKKEGTMKVIWDAAEAVYAANPTEPKTWRKAVFAVCREKKISDGTISAGFCTWKHSKGLA